MIHKYIKHTGLGFIVWPDCEGVYHAHVYRAVIRARGVLVSAGFAFIKDGKVNCFGRSESLNVDSLSEDSAELAKQLGLVVRVAA